MVLPHHVVLSMHGWIGSVERLSLQFNIMLSVDRIQLSTTGADSGYWSLADAWDTALRLQMAGDCVFATSAEATARPVLDNASGEGRRLQPLPQQSGARSFRTASEPTEISQLGG